MTDSQFNRSRSREPDCGWVGGAGQAWIFGGNGLLRALVVVLLRGRRRQGSRARAGWRPRARARQASHRDERRRFWLPVLATSCGAGRTRRPGRTEAADQRGIVLSGGGLPQRRATGGRDPCPLLSAPNLRSLRHLVVAT